MAWPDRSIHVDATPRRIPEVDPDETPEHPDLAGITRSRQQCPRCRSNSRWRRSTVG